MKSVENISVISRGKTIFLTCTFALLRKAITLAQLETLGKVKNEKSKKLERKHNLISHLLFNIDQNPKC